MKSYECTIFMGSIRNGSEGTHFTEGQVIDEIKLFQSQNLDRKVVVRVTRTKFVFMHYEEEGWEISAIQYPRFHIPELTIKSFMVDLAKYLKDHFDQRSISIMDSISVTYLGDEDEHSS